MSRPGYYLRSFPDNVPLKYLGRIKKGHNLNRKSLFVEVIFEGNAKNLWMPLELLPFLVRGRAYGKADRQKVSITKQFKGRQTRQLGTSYIRNVQAIEPLKSKSNEVVRFKLVTARGDYFISAYEFARALFFHDQHLVNAAFSPNGLYELASINIGNNEVEIRFPESTSYPASNLNQYQTKQHLSNLFLNEAYRKSFGSIFASRVKAEKNNDFHFNFVPPNLDGLHFEVLCRNPKDGVFDVYEVQGIQNRSFFYGGVVQFRHPRKKDVVKKESSDQSDGKDKVINRPDQPDEIDLHKSPGFGGNKKKVEDKGFYYQVINPVKTIVNSQNIEKEFGNNTQLLEAVSEIESGVMSVGRRSVEGSANYVEPRLSGNDSVLVRNQGGNTVDRFILFIETIDQVVEDLECEKYQIFYLPLPKPDKNYENERWISTVTGKARLVCLAQFHFKNIVFVALDVDIADLSNKFTICSRLVVFKNNKQSTENDKLDVILQALSNSKKISWPSNEVFDNVCEVNHRIIHPARKLYESIESIQIKKEVYVSHWSKSWKNKILQETEVDFE